MNIKAFFFHFILGLSWIYLIARLPLGSSDLQETLDRPLELGNLTLFTDHYYGITYQNKRVATIKIQPDQSHQRLRPKLHHFEVIGGIKLQSNKVLLRAKGYVLTNSENKISRIRVDLNIEEHDFNVSIMPKEGNLQMLIKTGNDVVKTPLPLEFSKFDLESIKYLSLIPGISIELLSKQNKWNKNNLDFPELNQNKIIKSILERMNNYDQDGAP